MQICTRLFTCSLSFVICRLIVYLTHARTYTCTCNHIYICLFTKKMRILPCGKPNNKAYVQLIALGHGDSSHPEKWELKMALGDSPMKFIIFKTQLL